MMDAWILDPQRGDGVAKKIRSTALRNFFQDLDMLDVNIHPWKNIRPCRTKSLHSHPISFCECIKGCAEAQLVCRWIN